MGFTHKSSRKEELTSYSWLGAPTLTGIRPPGLFQREAGRNPISMAPNEMMDLTITEAFEALSGKARTFAVNAGAINHDHLLLVGQAFRRKLQDVV